MNRNTYSRPVSGLYRKTALALMTAGSLLAMSGNFTHASAEPNKDFDNLRFDDKKDSKDCGNMPAAPEVATWCIGGAVLSIGGIGQLRRKWLASRQAGSL
jgi:hypothetical protein